MALLLTIQSALTAVGRLDKILWKALILLLLYLIVAHLVGTSIVSWQQWA
jgi:hypothetical protein